MLSCKLCSARLLFGLLVTLTFLGCVGLPERQKPKKQKEEQPFQPILPPRSAPTPAVKDAQSISGLRIPEAPKPQPPSPPGPLPDLTASPIPAIPSPSSGPTAQPVKQTGSFPAPPMPGDLQPTPPKPPTVSPYHQQPDPSNQLSWRRSVPPAPPSVQPAGTLTFRTSKPSNSSLETIQQIYQRAVKSYAGINSYIARMTRREMVKGKMQPEEVMLFKFRKAPWSVYFKWLGETAKGRELIYVKGQHDNKMQIRLAQGDIPLLPAGKRMAFAPDSILVRGNSRHDIRSAGVGKIIEQFGQLLTKVSRGDESQGTVAYHGKKKRAELPEALECIEWRLPPGLEKELPRGGRRWCYVDSKHHLPTLIVTEDDKGQMVEYYRYDRFQFPVQLDDQDFDPDHLWEKK